MNLIVICVDSWCADILGGRGQCRWIKAPALTDFAKQCVIFDRAFGEGMPTVQIPPRLLHGYAFLPVAS